MKFAILFAMLTFSATTTSSFANEGSIFLPGPGQHSDGRGWDRDGRDGRDGRWDRGGRGDHGRGRHDDRRPGRPGHGRGQTFDLGANSCGYGQGFCACVTAGQLYAPDAHAAARLCHERGYRHLVNFQTAPSYRGAIQCSGNSGGCFRNANPGNVVCTQITCSR